MQTESKSWKNPSKIKCINLIIWINFQNNWCSQDSLSTIKSIISMGKLKKILYHINKCKDKIIISLVTFLNNIQLLDRNNLHYLWKILDYQFPKVNSTSVVHLEIVARDLNPNINHLPFTIKAMALCNRRSPIWVEMMKVYKI